MLIEPGKMVLEQFRAKPTMRNAIEAFCMLRDMGLELPGDLLDVISEDFRKVMKRTPPTTKIDRSRVMMTVYHAIDQKEDGRSDLSVFDEYAEYFGISGTNIYTPGELLRERYKKYFKVKNGE